MASVSKYNQQGELGSGDPDLKILFNIGLEVESESTYRWCICHIISAFQSKQESLIIG